MTGVVALLGRDLRLAFRAGGGAMVALGFFAAVCTMVPFSIGSDPVLLARASAGVLWIGAVLSGLLALDRLFQADYEDGSLDVITLSPLSLETVAAAKITSHWITTGLPLTVLAPVLGVLLNLPERAFAPLVASLLIGTPALSAIGSIAAALTLSVRRGGLILPLLVLPLIVPVVIFGTGMVAAAVDGLQNGASWLLAAISLAAVLLSPFAAAAAVRLNLAE